jgi:hypothetical protein
LKKGDEKMKRLLVSSILGVALVAALGFGFIPELEQTASCQGCSSGGVANAKKIFEKFAEECEKLDKDSVVIEELCFKDKLYSQIFPKLKELAKANAFGPSNRILFAEKIPQLSGRPLLVDFLPPKGSHIFLVSAPATKKDIGIGFIREKGGNADVTICAIDKKGNQTLLGAIKWNENDDPSKIKFFFTKGIEGKVVQIEVKGPQGPFKKSTYSLSAFLNR